MRAVWRAPVYAIILALLARQALHVAHLLGLDTATPTGVSDLRCEVVTVEGGFATEDLKLIGREWAILSNFRLDASAAESRIDPLIALHLPTRSVRFLQLNGFPLELRFHAHGLFYDEEAKFLAAVNHAWDGGGDRIEIFSVSGGDSLTDPPSLLHLKSIASEAFGLGTLNGVAVYSLDPLEVYVTQSLPDGSDNGLFDPIVAMRFVLYAILNYRATALKYCDDTSCRSLPHFSLSWNGVAFDRGKRRLAAISHMTRELVVFNIGQETRAHLTEEARIPLFLPCDNVALARWSERVYSPEGDVTVWTTAGLRDSNDIMRILKAAAGDGKELGSIPSNGQLIVYGAHLGIPRPGSVAHGFSHKNYTVEVFYVGDHINAASSAAVSADASQVLLGSFVDNRVAICDL